MATVHEIDRPKADTQFSIEKTVPLPSGGYSGATRKYPLSDMEIGDSFFVSTDRPLTHALRRSTSAFGKQHNKRFTVRSVDGGLRCWRTA